MDWRRKRDFLHRTSDGEFKSLWTLWDRNKGDVCTIKEFYENEFLTRKQKQVIVFLDPDSFLRKFKDIFGTVRAGQQILFI
jgi:hypothetical protein